MRLQSLAYGLRARARVPLYETRILCRAHLGLTGKRHADGVIISVTTYPARLGSLRLPLLSLLHQTVRPEKVVLVLAEEEFPDRRLPDWLAALVNRHGIEILWTPDNLRSYKKLIPTLVAFPHHSIVTADDDLLYPPRWLEGLVEASARCPGTIVGYRAIPVLTDPSGSLRPYMEWLTAALQGTPTSALLLTTGGGVLFPPGSLPPEATDVHTALTVCPTADDIWFWAMTLLSRAKTVGIARTFVQHPQTRNSEDNGALYAINGPGGANDRQIKAVLDHFGLWDRLGTESQ